MKIPLRSFKTAADIPQKQKEPFRLAKEPLWAIIQKAVFLTA